MRSLKGLCLLGSKGFLSTAMTAGLLGASVAACAPDPVAPNTGGGDDAGGGGGGLVDVGFITPDAGQSARDTGNGGGIDAGLVTEDSGAVFIDIPVNIDLDAPLVDTGPGTVPTGDTGPRPDGPPIGQRDGGALANLIPVIQNTQIQDRTFTAESCEVMEGCTMPGNRRLLRFDLLTPNIGQGDLYLGSPTVNGRPLSAFEYGTCHRHWHLRGYADYRLVETNSTREVARGHKQSFCLLDSGRYMGRGADIPANQRYNCGNQGIHAGWYDAYGRSLDCQYVDITGVPAGTYRIRARINVERVVAESSYEDNESFLTVTIPPASGGGDAGTGPSDPTAACGGADEGLQRNCAWTNEGSRTCTPGSTVTVGCNAMCMPAIGLCAGDSMIRICPGATPCTWASRVADNDDACAERGRNTCSRVSFTCPPGGRYTVLTGAYRAGGSYECHWEAR